MGAHRFPMSREVRLGQAILCPIGEGTGLDHAGVHVGVQDRASPLPAGHCITVTVVAPVGSLMAMMTLEDVACLQDELDAAVAKVAGFVQPGSAA